MTFFLCRRQIDTLVSVLAGALLLLDVCRFDLIDYLYFRWFCLSVLGIC